MTISKVEQNLINQYISEKHPELKLATQDQILKVLLEEKAITQEQYNRMMDTSLFIYPTEDVSYDISQNMGFEKSLLKKINNQHNETSLLNVEKDGTLVQNQFEMEYIKSKYPESDYTIKENYVNEHCKVDDFEYDDKYTEFIILNKKTGKKAIKYTIYDDHITVDKYNEQDDVSERVLVNGGKNRFDEDKTEPWYVSAIYKNDDEGQDMISYNFRSLDIKEKRKYVKIGDIGDIKTRTVYTNNKPYKTTDDGKTVENSIVMDIKKTLNNKNILGGVKDINRLVQIINGITPQNVYEILNDYKSITGRDLLDDIEKAAKENNKVLKQVFLDELPGRSLIRHLRLCMQPDVFQMRDGLYFSHDAEIEYVTNRLIEDFNGQRNSETFLNDLELISSEGTDLFDKRCAFTGIVMGNFLEKTGKRIFNIIYEKNGLSDEQKYNAIIKLLYGFGRYRIEEFKNELDNFANNEEIMNFMFKNSGTYYEDIKADMVLHKNDTERWLVDMQRLYSRGECKDKYSEISNPNGKIDVDFKQGNTGDCWLLAGLISICKKDAGKNAVENLITVDNKNKTVNVHFRGVNKIYQISFDEINGANYLSGGDGDVRAVELAFDKYIREVAYSEGGKIDICGNTTEYMYSILFGETEHIDGYSKDNKYNFNSPKDYYCLGASGFQINDTSVLKDVVLKENGETTDFVTGHAYAIIKSDKEYVYLINPWDSSETLRITHENLEKLKPGIGHCKIG